MHAVPPPRFFCEVILLMSPTQTVDPVLEIPHLQWSRVYGNIVSCEVPGPNLIDITLMLSYAFPSLTFARQYVGSV